MPIGEQGGLDSESGSCPHVRLLIGDWAKTRRRRRAIFNGLGDVFNGSGRGLSSEPDPEPDNPKFNTLVFVEMTLDFNLYELISTVARGVTS